MSIGLWSNTAHGASDECRSAYAKATADRVTRDREPRRVQSERGKRGKEMCRGKNVEKKESRGKKMSVED